MNKKSFLLSLAFFASPLAILGGRVLFHLPVGLDDLSKVDYMTIALYWIAAGLLLTRMRFAWGVSALLSVLVSALNGIQMVRTFGEIGSVLPTIQFIFCIALMCSLIILMNYLDQSLFDRRDNFSIFGVAERKVITTKLILENEKAEPMTGTILSLSRSGFLADVSGFGSKMYLVDWKASLPDLGFKNLPVQIVEIDAGKKMRAQFGEVDFMTQFKLHKKIKAL